MTGAYQVVAEGEDGQGDDEWVLLLEIKDLPLAALRVVRKAEQQTLQETEL